MAVRENNSERQRGARLAPGSVANKNRDSNNGSCVDATTTCRLPLYKFPVNHGRANGFLLVYVLLEHEVRWRAGERADATHVGGVGHTQTHGLAQAHVGPLLLFVSLL